MTKLKTKPVTGKKRIREIALMILVSIIKEDVENSEELIRPKEFETILKEEMLGSKEFEFFIKMELSEKELSDFIKVLYKELSNQK